jgi:pilus assembly protein Flp/PilA
MSCLRQATSGEQLRLTVVEYAIAGGLVAAAVVTAFVGLGENVEAVIGGLCDEVGRSPLASGSNASC